jgi:hypothetical protein
MAKRQLPSKAFLMLFVSFLPSCPIMPGTILATWSPNFGLVSLLWAVVHICPFLPFHSHTPHPKFDSISITCHFLVSFYMCRYARREDWVNGRLGVIYNHSKMLLF